MSGVNAGLADRAHYIDVEAEVRYWEDASVNGVEDKDGTLIPGRVGATWKIRIELLDGIVVDWPDGMQADIHYKVCDQGEYWLSDVSGNRIAKWREHYVPNAFLCHRDEGFGDYIIMTIEPGGGIAGYHMPEIKAGDWAQVPALTAQFAESAKSPPAPSREANEGLREAVARAIADRRGSTVVQHFHRDDAAAALSAMPIAGLVKAIGMAQQTLSSIQHRGNVSYSGGAHGNYGDVCEALRLIDDALSSFGEAANV